MPSKKPSESQGRIQVSALVNIQKENTNLIEPAQCNEIQGKVKDLVAK